MHAAFPNKKFCFHARLSRCIYLGLPVYANLFNQTKWKERLNFLCKNKDLKVKKKSVHNHVTPKLKILLVKQNGKISFLKDLLVDKLVLNRLA